MVRQPEHLVEQQQSLGRFLATLREAASLYQTAIARAVPCHRTTVAHAEAGSQLPPSDFWEVADRVVGAKGALIARYDELIQAKAAYLADQQAKRRAQAQAAVQQFTAAASEQPAPAGGAGSAGEDGTPQRRETLMLSLAVSVTPDVLNRVLSDSAAEAMEFTQLAALSAVGRGTLDHLELVVSDLYRAYPRHPPAEQFVVARTYRSRVDELIRGRHTLKELQELYVYAGWLSGLLSLLAHDLGNLRTARAYALDSHTYADEVGHGELCGWAADAMACIAMDAGRPDSAAKVAMRSVAKVSASHPLAVRLHAQAARAHARLGQRELYETLFGEAQRLHERLPARTPILFPWDTGRQAFLSMIGYPVSACVWLGDFTAARTHGEAAVAVHESTLPGVAPRLAAVARLDLATALVGLGAPDDAVALGSQALTSMRMASSWVVARAHDLDKILVGRYPDLSCVREFNEQYRDAAQCLTVAQGQS